MEKHRDPNATELLAQTALMQTQAMKLQAETLRANAATLLARAQRLNRQTRSRWLPLLYGVCLLAIGAAIVRL